MKGVDIHLNVFELLNYQEQQQIYDYAANNVLYLDENKLKTLFNLYDQAKNNNDSKTAAKLELLASEFFKLCKVKKLRHMLCKWLVELPSYIFEPEKSSSLIFN